MTWGQLRFILQAQFPEVTSLDIFDAAINSRYEQVLAAADWGGLKGHTTIQTEAAYQSGVDNCTLTVGDGSVAGDGTAWDPTLVETQFYRPGDSAIYQISAVPASNVLVLDRPYEGTGGDAPGTVRAGSAYVLMQNVYRLPEDCGWVVSILSPTTGRPMQRMSELGLDQSVGQRTLLGDPMAWDLYDDSDPASPPVLHQVEFYPPPLYARGMLVNYTRAALGFDGQDTSASPLPWVSSAVLLYGCRADIAMHLEKFAAAKLYEEKFAMELAKLLRVEFGQRRSKTAFGMASRFTRHRMGRVSRGRGGAWRGGVQGGPD